MAIELAMIVMVVTFALSILLTTLALMQSNRKNVELNATKEKIALEQIGEDYLAAIRSEELDSLYAQKGDYEIIDKTEQSLVVRRISSNETALTIELDADGRITVWKLD